MLNDSLSYLVFFPAAVLCFLPMAHQLRYSRLRTLLMGVGLITAASAVGVWLTRWLNTDDNDLLLPLLMFFFVLYHHSLKVHISKSLAVFCACTAFLSILSNGAICFDAYLDILPTVNTDSWDGRLFQISVGWAAVLLLARPYIKYGSMLIDRTEQPRIWYATILFSATVFAVNMLLLPVEYAVIEQPELRIYMVLVLIALLILWLLMQDIFFLIVSGILNAAEIEAKNRFLETQKHEFDSQQRYIKATEKVRHDFRQSIRTMSELYEAGDYEELGEYLRQYVRTMPTGDIRSFCDNTALNALLNYYVHVAGENGISFTPRIRLPEKLRVSDIDLCNMIGNILENAIIACQKADEKYIRLSAIAEDDIQLYIVVVNSFSGDVSRNHDGRYLSVSHGGNGIGLWSVLSTAESYGGVAQFSHEGKRFYSSIAIPLDG
ncbi:MAG: sensor histidine kinase [Clostridia bacterium]|nr:sensor histidine kinase [Clostridia bacterium]